MRTVTYLFIFIVLAGVSATAQNKTLGIGTGTPNGNAALHVESPTGNQGFIMPRLTTAQRTSFGFTSILGNADNGLMVYDSDEKTLYIWDGATWKSSQQVAHANLASSANKLVLPYVDSVLTAPNNSNLIRMVYKGSGVENVGVAQFENLNTQNGFNALFVRNYGTNGAGYFQVLNPNSASPALRAITNTNQAAMHGILGRTTGTGGSGGSFEIINAASTQPALVGTTTGTGSAGYFNINNASSTSPALSIVSNGTGNAITANKPIQATAFIGDGSALTGVSSTPGANSVTTGTIVDGTITNADVSASAAIAGSKVIPAFGTQNISTTGTLSGGAATLTGLTISGATASLNTVAYSWPAIQGAASTVLTNNGSGVLTWSSGGSGWGLTGTGGTVDGTNFIGTTDNVPLTFKVSNQKAGRIDPNGAVFFGYRAGEVNTYATSTGIGYVSLRNNTTGSDNTALGYWTLFANTTGNDNVAVGRSALGENISGRWNTAVGSSALGTNTIGESNTAMGMLSLSNNVGSSNTAIGDRALSQNVSGNSNTAIGSNALNVNTTGSNNTAIGINADVSLNNLTNATAIGNGAIVNVSNKIRLGNTLVTIIEGQVAFTAASDRRLKTNIHALNDGLDLIMKLRPVSYYMKNQIDPKLNWGFIAQDIETLIGTQNAVLTIGGDKDRTLGLRYTDFIAPLVKAVQEQQQIIEVLQSKLNQMEEKMNSQVVKKVEETITGKEQE